MFVLLKFVVYKHWDLHHHQRNLYTWIIYVRWIFQVIYFLLLFCACCSGIVLCPQSPDNFVAFTIHFCLLKLSLTLHTQKLLYHLYFLCLDIWYMIVLYIFQHFSRGEANFLLLKQIVPTKTVQFVWLYIKSTKWKNLK